MISWDDITPTGSSKAVEPAPMARGHAYIIVVGGANAGEIFRIGRGGAMIGRTRDADIRLLDNGVSRRHAVIRAEGGRLLLHDLGSRNGTACNGQRATEHDLDDGDRIQLGRSAVLQLTFSAQLDELFRQKTFESSLHDDLTRAFNRRYFTDRLESELRFANRHEESLALLVLDIDHFRQINETHGGPAGDHVLRSLAEVLQRNVRNEDVFARYGGEEFVIISRAIPQANAYLLAERLRKLVENLGVVHEDAQIPVTVSVGVAAFPEVAVTEGAELIAAADQALRRAKEQGAKPRRGPRRGRLRAVSLTPLAVLSIACLFASSCSSGSRTRSARAARVVAAQSGGVIADHRAVTEFESIPAEYIEKAKKDFSILYGRTSHGTQIEIGMHMVIANHGGPYRFSFGFMKTRNGDLGSQGNMAWREATGRALSGAGSGYNMVMWSWCGGVSTNDQAGIQAYLDAMSQLEEAHPGVVFVYMTGHADRWRTENTRKNNQLIRDYCEKNGKVLFDFEDIESWDLEGKFHPDTGDACQWCEAYCSTNTCPRCTDCPHSHCLNCYNKGKAFWWMMARLAGWPGAGPA